jgi:hypothetical protein
MSRMLEMNKFNSSTQSRHYPTVETWRPIQGHCPCHLQHGYANIEDGLDESILPPKFSMDDAANDNSP